MSKNKKIILSLVIFAVAYIAVGFVWHWTLGFARIFGDRPKDATAVNRRAKISPDYCGVVVPFNIAPMNFAIKEEADSYFVRVTCGDDSFDVFCRDNKVIMPVKKWKALLNDNKGRQISFDIFTCKGGNWKQYKSIKNEISSDAIDNYISYRRIPPVRIYIDTPIGIYQRDLSSYDENLILTNDYYYGGCLNCHNFSSGNSRVMTMGVRSRELGDTTLIIDKDKVENLDIKIGYNTWHCSEKIVAYSVNKVVQFVNTAGAEFREVFDLDSMIAYYDRDARKVKTADVISRKDRQETYPCFSPDGKYLYFCSAPMLWKNEKQLPPPDYKDMKYDIVRVSYDVDNDSWGQVEMVVSAEMTGGSNLLPRISYDGRWLIFCVTDYGCFPSHSPSSDLWIADLNAEDIKPRKMKINSGQSESWHSFSSNNRWVAFSTKRRNGTFTRTYIGYLNDNGQMSRPFLIPVKDPGYFDMCREGFTVPEFSINSAILTGEKLGRVIRKADKIPVSVPVTMATPEKQGKSRYDSAE